jgi:hypothetical protein
MPGCEGAKVRRTEQVALAGRRVGQLVVKVKSPVMPRVRGNGCAPELPMVTVWVVVEVLVTTTALGKVMEVGLRVRLGLTDWPVPLGWRRVVPVKGPEELYQLEG